VTASCCSVTWQRAPHGETEQTTRSGLSSSSCKAANGFTGPDPRDLMSTYCELEMELLVYELWGSQSCQGTQLAKQASQTPGRVRLPPGLVENAGSWALSRESELVAGQECCALWCCWTVTCSGSRDAEMTEAGWPKSHTVG
jgi:hypothetical protein